ncbi:hypothetical protein ElyMa_001953800, partial [Elysia marginata]
MVYTLQSARWKQQHQLQPQHEKNLIYLCRETVEKSGPKSLQYAATGCISKLRAGPRERSQYLRGGQRKTNEKSIEVKRIDQLKEKFQGQVVEKWAQMKAKAKARRRPVELPS